MKAVCLNERQVSVLGSSITNFYDFRHYRSRVRGATPHLLLAIACVRLGRLTDARREVEKMLKINPAITVQAWKLGYSFRDPAILDRYALDLVQSGLPEK